MEIKIAVRCAAVVAVSAALSGIASAVRIPDAEQTSSAGAINTTAGAEGESVAGSLDTSPAGLVINVS